MLYLYVQCLRISVLCTCHCIYLTLIAEAERPEKKSVDSDQTPCLCCTRIFSVYGYPVCVHITVTVITLLQVLRRSGLRKQCRPKSDALFMFYPYVNVKGYLFCVHIPVFALTLSAETERPEKTVQT